MSMKIVAGFGAVTQYPEYVKAGADELFCGYVPERWTLKYRNRHPLNRREAALCNVQLGSFSELEILADMKAALKAPVSITMNYPGYIPEQYSEAADIMKECMSLGFDRFIAADPALFVYLKKHGPTGVKLTISGEAAADNHYAVNELIGMGADRLIFHRKMDIDDMKLCISELKKAGNGDNIEFEAFILNENCHFSGGFCNSVHCDEFVHICRLMYRLGGMDRKISASDSPGPAEEQHTAGSTGCGLCALPRLQQAGITHLKVVSRGNFEDETIRDIKLVRRALELLDEKETDNEFAESVKHQLFSDKCSGRCYYL